MGEGGKGRRQDRELKIKEMQQNKKVLYFIKLTDKGG